MPTPSLDLFHAACDDYSLAGLRRLVRWHIDGLQETESGDYIPDPEWPDEFLDMAINEAYVHYTTQQVLAFEGNYYKEQDFPLAAADRTIKLPKGVFKVDRVFMRVGSDFYPLNYSMGPHQADYGYPNGGWMYWPTFYVQDALMLKFTPPAGGDTTVRVRWYELPGCLRGDKARFNANFLPIWTWVVVLDAAIICIAKDEGDPTELAKIRDRYYMSFINSIEERTHTPKFVAPGYPGYEGAA